MDYFEILGIDEEASDEQIKKAYHKMALRNHPDKNHNPNAEEHFKKVVEAYEVLSDPIKRRRYILSRKNNEDYKFHLSPDILKFSKYFFSEDNIRKFTNISSSISKEMGNYGININFELMLNGFLNNIRNGSYKNIIEEYLVFKKFYDMEFKKVELDEEELRRKYQMNQKYSNKTKYNNVNNTNKCNNTNKFCNSNRCNNNKSNTMNKNTNDKNNDGIVNMKKYLQNKSVNINIRVDLEDIYNKKIKNANINIDKLCVICNGSGVVNKYDNNNNQKGRKNRSNRGKKNKNGKSKKHKSSCNISNEELESLKEILGDDSNINYENKKICSLCQGTMKKKEKKSFLIDTSIDKICYLDEIYKDSSEGYYDLVFNIIQKPSDMYTRKDRYDLVIKKDISLYEYYYGGNYKFKHLDSNSYEINWYPINDGSYKKNIIMKNLGLIIIEDKNKLLDNKFNLIDNKPNLINDKFISESEYLRGDLIIELNLKLPIYKKIELENDKLKTNLKDVCYYKNVSNENVSNENVSNENVSNENVSNENVSNENVSNKDLEN